MMRSNCCVDAFNLYSARPEALIHWDIDVQQLQADIIYFTQDWWRN